MCWWPLQVRCHSRCHSGRYKDRAPQRPTPNLGPACPLAARLLCDILGDKSRCSSYSRRRPASPGRPDRLTTAQAHTQHSCPDPAPARSEDTHVYRWSRSFARANGLPGRSQRAPRNLTAAWPTVISSSPRAPAAACGCSSSPCPPVDRSHCILGTMVRSNTSAPVIFLNGASSSGKTSIALALQNQLGRPSVHLSEDAFFDMAMGARLGGTATERVFGIQVLLGLYRSIGIFATLGLTVIVDVVLEDGAGLPEGVERVD